MASNSILGMDNIDPKKRRTKKHKKASTAQNIKNAQNPVSIIQDEIRSSLAIEKKECNICDTYACL